MEESVNAITRSVRCEVLPGTDPEGPESSRAPQSFGGENRLALSYVEQGSARGPSAMAAAGPRDPLAPGKPMAR